MYKIRLIESIKIKEGYRARPYVCSAGKTTVGYGTNLDDGITEKQAVLLLESELEDLEVELNNTLFSKLELDDVRKYVLFDMAYNMGVPRLLKFKKTIEYISKGDYESASIEMLDSKWHRDFVKYDMQDGKRFDGLLRSEHLSKIMKEGKY